jgi:NADH-quinone oxidoreductase subunit E
MNAFNYTQENEQEFQRLLTRYPNSDSLMLPSLWLVQEQEGWVSPEAMIYVANKLGKSPIEVHSFASFYTMFNLTPIGTYHIELCKTLSCMLMGSREIKQFIKETIGIEPGQTSQDGKFHLTEVECMGACGGAPAMAINGKYYEKLSKDKVGELLKGCKA